MFFTRPSNTFSMAFQKVLQSLPASFLSGKIAKVQIVSVLCYGEKNKERAEMIYKVIVINKLYHIFYYFPFA